MSEFANEIKSGFVDYLVEKGKITEEDAAKNRMDDSDVSIFAYFREFQDYLVSENYAGSDIYTKSISDISDMNFVDGKLVDNDDDSNTDQTSNPTRSASEPSNTDQTSNPSPTVTEPSNNPQTVDITPTGDDNVTLQTTPSENIFLNPNNTVPVTDNQPQTQQPQTPQPQTPQIKDVDTLLNDIYSDSDSLLYLDVDGDGVISDSEKDKFQKYVQGDNAELTVEDLEKAYNEIKNDTFNISEYLGLGKEDEVEDIEEPEEADDIDDKDKPNAANSPNGNNNVGGAGGSGGGGGGVPSHTATPTEKTIDNMTKEELQAERQSAESKLSDQQGKLSSILDGSDEEMAGLQENVDKSYEKYHDELEKVAPELAEQLDDIVNKISDQESLIDEQEMAVSNQEVAESEAQTQLGNAQSTLNAAQASLDALNAVSATGLDDEQQADLSGQIAAAEAAVAEAEIAVQEAENNLQEQQDSLSEMKQELDNMKGENGLGALKAQKDALDQQILSEHQELAGFQKDYNDAKSNFDKTKETRISDAKADILGAQDYINQIDEKLNEFDNFEMQRGLRFSQLDKLFSDDKMTVSDLIMDGEHMPYRVICPKDLDPTKDYPAILYLQGANGTDGGPMRVGGLTEAVLNSDLSNFNGYIIIPECVGYTDANGKYHGEFASGGWESQSNVGNLRSLMDSFTSTHNVDMDNIAIAGSSDGARGALVAASSDAFRDYFRAMTIMSGFNINVDYSKINIPVYGYSGSPNGDGNPGMQTPQLFSQHFDYNNYTQIDGLVHASTAQTIHNYDANRNGCPDWIEQLFDY